MKIIKGDLIMTEDMTFNDDLRVEGNIYGKRYNLNCYNLTCYDLTCNDLNCYNLTCNDLNCYNLNCYNLTCYNLTCYNLTCYNLNCHNLNCLNLDCLDLDFYAIAICYYSFKCKSWKARRDKYIIKCLDGEIEVQDENNN